MTLRSRLIFPLLALVLFAVPSAAQVISEAIEVSVAEIDVVVLYVSWTSASSSRVSIDAGGLRGDEGSGAENPARLGRLNSSLIRTNDLTRAFEELSDHVSTYYSLGYRAEGAKKAQRVNVRVRKPGLTVRATRSIRERTSGERAGDAVRSRLYDRIEENSLGVLRSRAQSERPRPSRSLATLRDDTRASRLDSRRLT